MLYSEERDGHLLAILNHDPKTGALLINALSTWTLGYPEQAVKITKAWMPTPGGAGTPLIWALL